MEHRLWQGILWRIISVVPSTIIWKQTEDTWTRTRPVQWVSNEYTEISVVTRPGHGPSDPPNPTQSIRKKTNPTNTTGGYGPWFLTQNLTQPKKTWPRAKKPTQIEKLDLSCPTGRHGSTRPTLGTSWLWVVPNKPWPDPNLTRCMNTSSRYQWLVSTREAIYMTPTSHLRNVGAKKQY
jgi:hypothetical protein